MPRIRTRYAPSPTGFLHIGGARTALFNYLFAKHHGGEFIFRTEDTDHARNVEGGEASQIDNLTWLGVIPDESPRNPNPKYAPYRQSEKLAHYQSVADELIKKNKAYKAYDTVEEIAAQRAEQEKTGIFSFRYERGWLKLSEAEIAVREANRAYAIRLALTPNKVYEWNDIVRGKITVNTNDIGDWVIIKQDGYPTYNFSVVIDDHDMEITHVLRGEEHVTNTPKQLAVFDAMNWTPPLYGHLTIITDMSGKKLSKRDTTLKQFVEDFKIAGYLPEALFNFLALLGWTHAQAKELLSIEELIHDFDPRRLSSSPSKFDTKKLEWFAREYFKQQPNASILPHVHLPTTSKTWIELFLDTYKQAVASYSELQVAANNFANRKVKQMKHPRVVTVFAEQLKKEGSFSDQSIKHAISATGEMTGLKGKDLFLPIRLATTYEEHGPELSKAIFLTGETLVKARLEG